jgi:PKD repeat protein
MRKLLLNRWLFITAVLLMAGSCGEDEGSDGNPVASFQFEADETDFLTIHFENFSKNADEFSWNFGDGSAVSTEEDPSHTYEASGTYSVVLSATGNGKTVTQTKEVIVTNPNEALKALTGDVSKSWKLLRDVSTGRYPLEVGPATRAEIWWAFGRNEQLGVRPCTLDDEYIFSLDGTFEYKTNGDFWAEGMQAPIQGCEESIDANYVNAAGTSVAAWNSGVHEFEYNVANQKITLTGLGAFIGLQKAATDAEVTVPQEATTYSVVKLSDGAVDTLIIETTIPDGYWRFVLVHYDNPLEEPEIPGAAPTAGFTYVATGNSVAFTNTSTDATSYSWDFGDASSSTQASPTHVYANSGSYTVVLSATNANGTTTSTQTIVLGATDITLADLTGGSSKIWKLKPVAGAFRVGPAIGSGEWFSSNGAADITNRACMFDDEFIFYSTMAYDYDTKGQVFAEPFMGGTNACMDDAAIPGVYAALGSSTTHTFEFTPAAGGNRVQIKVIGTGAFAGFAKPYNGGEYNGTDVALATSVTYDVFTYTSGGGVETLEISVPINAEKTAWWTMILVHQ